MSNTDKHSGGCLCGAVRYEVRGPLRDVVNCYCSMCRQVHGSMGAYSKADEADIVMIEERGLKWYASSSWAKRGFCSECGSALFWKPADQSGTGIVAGSLDQPSGLKIIGHIYVREKADFLEIADDLPQYERDSHGRITGE